MIGFEAFQKQSDPSVRGQHKIVIDPLGHCQAGSKYFKNNLIFGRVPLPIFLSTDLFKGIQTHPDIKAVTFYGTLPVVRRCVAVRSLTLQLRRSHGADGRLGPR